MSKALTLPELITNPKSWIVLGALVFWICLWLVTSQIGIPNYENNIAHTIYSWPESLKWPFLAITQLGSVWMVLVLAVYLAWRRRKLTLVRLAMSAAVTYLLATALKFLVGRARPDAIYADIVSRELFVGTGQGFPSAHAALAAAVAVAVWPNLPARWRRIIPVLVLLVGLSRIYLGVHFPLDVLAGLGLGVAVGSFVQLQVDKIKP